MPFSSETCRLCREQSAFAFLGHALNHQVKYYDCAACGFFQTESPHWLGEAYATAINDADTGIMWRNLQNVPRVIGTLLAFGKLKGRVVDHAGGYGILVRLLRDSGIDARWQDKHCQNLVARGFEAGEEACDLVTAFEVFEHFVDPMAELHAMLDRAPLVLLSTELIRTDPNRDATGTQLVVPGIEARSARRLFPKAHAVVDGKPSGRSLRHRRTTSSPVLSRKNSLVLAPSAASSRHGAVSCKPAIAVIAKR